MTYDERFEQPLIEFTVMDSSETLTVQRPGNFSSIAPPMQHKWLFSDAIQPVGFYVFQTARDSDLFSAIGVIQVNITCL